MKKLITSPMKKLHKTIFRRPTKKTPSMTRSESDQSSTSFGGSSSSISSNNGSKTPTSVLPPPSADGAAYDELRQAFHMIDSDGDGKITNLELRAFLARLGAGSSPDDDELRLMVDEVDGDGDGCITLEEFCSAVGSAFAPPSCDEEVRETFQFFDSDGDGRISAEELYGVFTAISGGGDACSIEDCRRMIGGVDRNGDGFVCFEDFRTMMEDMTNLLVR